MTRLLRRLIGRDDLTPSAADGLLYARRALRDADRALDDAAEWLAPPLGPASPEQAADIALINDTIAATRKALKEVMR